MTTAELPTLQLLEQEAGAAIRAVLIAGHPVFVAYSGGKDSTAVLALALNTARSLKEEGLSVPPVIVTHGDTGIENPTVSMLAQNEMQKVREFGRRHGLTVRAEIAYPALNDTWAVSVLSGRKLPTFANSSSRDCTVAYKIEPMVRLRKRLLAEHGNGHPPVTLIGTRFEESTGRAARMTDRGESALTPWEKNGALFLSPIANWTSDDVWEFLGRLRAGDLEAFTDGADVFDLYASAGGTSCAVVADMATEGAKKARACGARFGCSLCAAVGRDKSLETMLDNDPGYAWLRGVNRVQRFIVQTQYDLSRRNWLGRSIDADGFLTVGPDTYASQMVAELLRYCLTVDAEELEAAYAAGLTQPRFQLVTPQQLVAIDALWGLHALHAEPFAAVKIWLDVHEHGQRYHPPESLVAGPSRSLPAPRYLYVGENWDEGDKLRYAGLRNLLAEVVSREGSPNRTLKDGTEVLRLEASNFFDVDEEGAQLFLEWEAQRSVDRAAGHVSNRSFFTYVSLGTISTSSKHAVVLDGLMRRTTWKYRHGLAGSVSREELLARSVAKADRAQAKAQALEQAEPARELSPRERLCHPVYL